MLDLGATLAACKHYEKAWYMWRSVWNGVNYLLGSGSAALTVIIAANSGRTIQGAADAQTTPPKGFLTPKQVTIIAAVAASLSFILATTKPAEKAGAYQAAARHIESGLVEHSDNEAELRKIWAEAIKELP
jgi:hypothetical protein